MRWRYLLPILLAAGLFAMFAVGLRLHPGDLPSPLIGKPAPAFTLPALLQPQQSVSQADWAGRVTLVNVWASWCITCKDEHAFLRKLAARGVYIIGIDYKDERAAALRWLETLGNPYAKVAFDGSGRVAIDWGVYKVPESYVLDKHGIIRYKQLGEITPAIWQQRIAPLMHKLEQQP